jgi:AHBA synthesis associated protein
MLKAVIFDLDGVLIDSEPLMRFAFAASYRQVVGEGPLPIETYLEHMGESFPQIMDHLGLPHELWEPYCELCERHVDQITLFPKTRNLLTWAQSTLKLRLAILTGKDQARTSHILEHFDLAHFFSVVIAADQLNRAKPDPEGILRILQLLDCPADQAVMVGDAVSDILCAKQAGVRSIAVLWGIKPERLLQLSQPDYVAQDWAGLDEILLKLSASNSASYIYETL